MDQDDEPVLGRGLESLIPKKNGNGQNTGPASFSSFRPSNAASFDPFQDRQGSSGNQPEPDREPERVPKEDIPPTEPAVPLVPEPQPHVLPNEGEVPFVPIPELEPNLPEVPAEAPPIQYEHHPTDNKYPDAIFQIEIDKIKPNPDQPRRIFDEDGLKDLAASIREFGLLQPLVVSKQEREVPTGTEIEYVLISGERRLRACKLLGLERVPAIVRNVPHSLESLELAVIENIQRENLNPVELARAYARLQDEFRLTQREIASRLGKSRESVANTVRLLDLPPAIQEALEQGQISESHGRLLLTIDNPALQIKLFRDLLENRMTTRELQSRARAGRPKRPMRAPSDEEVIALSPEMKFLQERLSQELGAPVAIHQHGSTGRITINFYSEEELQSILNRIGGAGDAIL